MLIKIIEVEAPRTVNKGKNTWKEMAIAYRAEDGKVGGKVIRSFAFPKVWEYFLSAQPGTTVNVVNKKEGEFWNWTAIGEDTETPTKEAAPSPEGKPARSYTSNRDYETAEERAWKQVLIIRQSSVSSAIAILSVGKAATLKPADVLSVAAEIEAWVGRDKAVQALIDLPNDSVE